MDLMAFLRNPFIFKSVTCTLVFSEDRLLLLEVFRSEHAAV